MHALLIISLHTEPCIAKLLVLTPYGTRTHDKLDTVQREESEVGGKCSSHGVDENAFKFLVGKPQENA